MTPRLEACYFVRPGSDGRWARLARVLEYSAERQCHGWRIHVQAITPVQIPSEFNAQTYEANTQKLDYWNEAVQASSDGEQLLLIDADTMVIRPLDDIWAMPFDVAYTSKQARFKLNGGVVFVRVSARSKQFMAAWAAENRRLLAEGGPGVWRFKWGGVNQASLAHVLDTPALQSTATLALPCREWNCEDSSWETFDLDVTRIVHVKGVLRQACLNRPGAEPSLEHLSSLWRSVEQQAVGSPVAGAR